MIALPRSLARRCHAVLRRCFARAPAGVVPFLVLRSGPQGLMLEAVTDDVAVRLEAAGPGPAAVLAFRGAVLAQFAGQADDPVTLAPAQPGHACASWVDQTGPCRHEFAVIDPAPLKPFPELPDQMRAQPAGLLRALAAAAKTAAQEKGRLALQRVLLRGGSGQVVATDGKQLLVQGFSFPWPEDLRVPRLAAWDSRDLPEGLPVAAGDRDGHVFLRVGPWAFALHHDGAGRYPDWQQVIPTATTPLTRVRFEEEDVRRLLQELPRLPGAADDLQPVTLRLGPKVVVVARAGHAGHAVELVLDTSSVSGPVVTLATDRRPLLRCWRLG